MLGRGSPDGPRPVPDREGGPRATDVRRLRVAERYRDLVVRAAAAEEATAIAERIAAYNPVTLDWSKKALDDIPAHVSDWTAALEYGRSVTSVIQNQIGKDKVTPAKF